MPNSKLFEKMIFAIFACIEVSAVQMNVSSVLAWKSTLDVMRFLDCGW